jgi:hypothetical protein
LLGTGKEQFRGLLKANVYLSFARASSDNYRGLIRLSPAIGFRTLKDGEQEFLTFLELAILGQRSMFSDEFDSL